jgi:uncharacterized DUF497 family protein
MTLFDWDEEKNKLLKQERGVCFEEVVVAIQTNGLLQVLAYPNQKTYPGQRIFVVEMNAYAYLVPFVENSEYYVLKTIIPSRKATRDYLNDDKDQN